MSISHIYHHLGTILIMATCCLLLAACDSTSSLSDDEDCMPSPKIGGVPQPAKSGFQEASSCTGPSGGDGFIYKVEVASDSDLDTFRIQIFSKEQIEAAEQSLRDGRRGVISGILKPGDGGFNLGYSWHLDPESVSFPDVATEVCDGYPGFVESELEYWIDTVGSFCPWGAEVIGRIDQ